jgi:hypothetical protein
MQRPEKNSEEVIRAEIIWGKEHSGREDRNMLLGCVCLRNGKEAKSEV